MKRHLPFFILTAVLTCGFHGRAGEEPSLSRLEETLQEQQGSGVQAVPFPEGLDWLNVSRPLASEDLKGKVVLLDFWTYACINCVHIIPDLKKLEAAYPKELAVIGVHSAKFTTEKISENIRQSIMRYEVRHPVLNDAAFILWKAYGINAWPSLVLIDPEGRVVLSVSGEGHYALLSKAVQFLIDQHKRSGKSINQNPLPLAYEGDKFRESILKFPGKIFADQRGLVISDTGHHQIVLADFDGTIRLKIGSGKPGNRDGTFEEAEFQYPQGVFREGNQIYVADTENHLIREIRLLEGRVNTIAGTGVQGDSLKGNPAALQTALNSPWDLVKTGDRIFTAMAGAHQIWALDLKNGRFELFAGSGRENIADGKGGRSAFAQPSGLAFDGKDTFYVADSEVSGIRSVHLKSRQVETLIGRGLFEFGDRDGSFQEALLQHPTGTAYENGFIYVADTYNSKLKRIDTAGRTIQTLDAPRDFLDEPGGLSIWAHKIYMADTNHHAIRVFDLARQTFSELALHEDENPEERSAELHGEDNLFLKTIRNEETTVIQNAKVFVNVVLPEAHEFTEDVPLRLKVQISPGKENKILFEKEYPEPAKTLPIQFELGRIENGGAFTLQVEADVPYCSTVQPKLCKFKSLEWIQPLSFSDQGKKELHFTAEL